MIKRQSRSMKNMTCRNLMIVIRRIQAKGYEFSEAERMARSVFDEFAAAPGGLSIEERVRRILTKIE